MTWLDFVIESWIIASALIYSILHLFLSCQATSLWLRWLRCGLSCSPQTYQKGTFRPLHGEKFFVPHQGYFLLKYSDTTVITKES